MIEFQEGLSWDDYKKAIEEDIKFKMSSKWSLGFNDRGLGHGDIGIIILKEKEEMEFDKFEKDLEDVEEFTQEQLKEFRQLCKAKTPVVVIPNIPKEIAEHLIELHNNSLKG